MANEAQSSGGIAGGGGGGGSVNSVNSGTDITVDNTDPANPIVNFSGTNNTPIEVANYSALPAPGTATGRTYIVLASQGTQWLPGSLGGTYYGKGYYYDNGVTYTYSEIPYNATQTEVNTGTNTDKFVTPATLASATTVIPKTGTTGDIISFSATNTPTRIAAGAAGTFLRNTGVATLPVVSTLVLPNSATANYIPYATSTNTWGESIDMRFDGTTFKLFNSFPSLHVRSNIASNGGVLVYQRGGESISSANQRYAMNIAAYGNGGAIATGNMCMIGFTHPDATSTLYTPSTIIGSVFETGGNFGNSGFFVATRSVTTDTRPTERFRVANNGNVSIGTGAIGTALLHIAAGTETTSSAPLKFTAGTNLTTAEAGAVEYNNTFHVTNSDATRRHIATAPNTTKVTAGAPYTNDGYVVINIGGTDFKVMTTA